MVNRWLTVCSVSSVKSKLKMKSLVLHQQEVAMQEKATAIASLERQLVREHTRENQTLSMRMDFEVLKQL